MQVPVVIEKVGNNGYRPRTGEPLALSAEGSSAEEAVSRLQVLLQARIDAGTRLVFIEVPTPDNNPWLVRLRPLLLLTYPQRRQALECFPTVETSFLNAA